MAIHVLALVAPILALALAGQAFALTFYLAGGTPPTAADVRVSKQLSIATCLVAAGAPVVGLAIALRAGRRSSAWLFGGMLIVGLVFAALVAGFSGLTDQLADAVRPAPEPASTRSVCQEYSGGDTHCPGG